MNSVKASICTIGDEILIGQIIDTNSSMISRALGAIGVRTSHMLSLGDERSEIIDLLSNELSSNEIVISTGGLGPTRDDITKDALAELSGSHAYVKHEEQEAIVHKILKARGLDVLEINLRQALVPDTCEVIVNRRGTAPIMVFRCPPGRNRRYKESLQIRKYISQNYNDLRPCRVCPFGAHRNMGRQPPCRHAPGLSP